ncbi:MAG: prepilin-type N-terminal cleavage/methylation domain-containing protein [Candidatus Zixiibacteriota bacterium]
MLTDRINYSRKESGFTLIELLIAVLITGILAAAAFQFYVTMHQQVITQQEISDMQQVCRSSLQEIGKTLRMAGYLLDTHPDWETNGCSLSVYFSATDTIDDADTVLYFLQEYSDTEYVAIPHLPVGTKLYKLMKQENSGSPQVFSDFITSINFVPIGTSEMAVTIQVQTTKWDESWDSNNGFRIFSNTERVNMRNVSM